MGKRRSLFIIAGLLGICIAGPWWIVSPTRKAKTFFQLLTDGQIDAANRMMVDSSPQWDLLTSVQPRRKPQLLLSPRNASDYFGGIQRFQVTMFLGDPNEQVEFKVSFAAGLDGISRDMILEAQ